jgi:putative transcriptional regulator
MDESLRGKLLLASPTLLDPNFVRTVVLIAEHTEEGAMGLVLNRPAASSVSEAVPDLAWLTGDEELVYVGGPVAETAVIVLAEFERPEVAGALVEGDLGFVGTDADDAEVLEGAIRRARVFAGHAGWGPG